MSYPVNHNLALAYSEIPFKTFVRESNVTISETPKNDKFKLEFKGHEAKQAYEEVISTKSQRRSLPRKCHSIPKNNKNKLEDSAKSTVNKANNINTLFKAIELGDESFIKEQFNSENVNICDQFGWTPLMSATYSGHMKIVEFFLNIGADTKLRDRSGNRAIDLALKRNHLAIIDILKRNSERSHKKEAKKNRKIIDKDETNVKLKDRKGFYCDLCKIFFMESSRDKHETSTLHVFNSKPKIANACYGIPRGNVGYQMLLNSGWNNEYGLGPTGEGQKYPVKTILKRDRGGLGQPNKSPARVSHFNSNDTNAVRSVYKNKRKTFTMKDRKKQLSRDAAKTRALRQALS